MEFSIKTDISPLLDERMLEQIKLRNKRITYIKTDDTIGKSLKTGNYWEEWMFKYIQQNYKENTNIIDLGGNIGTTTLMMSEVLSDNCNIFTFEPLYSDILLKNVLDNNLIESVIIYPYGVGNEKTTLSIKPINLSDNINFGAVSLKSIEEEKSRIKIKIVPLDHFNFKNISLIKIDVEGMEIEVLEGCLNLIKQWKPTIIIETYKLDQLKQTQVFKELSIIGYEIYNIPEGYNDYIMKINSDNGKKENSLKVERHNIENGELVNKIPVIIISLEKHKSRRIAMEKKIKNTILQNYKYFIAIDGETDLYKYKFNIMENYIDPILNRKINVGEIGCMLSHYFVWKYIVKNNIDKCLILEDDTTFNDDFNLELEKIMNIKLKYELFYLCRQSNNLIYNHGSEIEVYENIVIPKYSYNSNAYIITNSGAKKLIKTNILDNILPVDEYMSIMYDKAYPFKQYSSYFSNYDKLNALALKDDISNQEYREEFPSSIEESRIYK
jgi:FkbM family methyltransferase